MSTLAAVKLSAWLARKGKTQGDLARLVSTRLGRAVSQSTIARACAGRSVPRGDIQSALLKIAGVRVEWWSELVASQST
jgi:transcriptional regulator with XRE-family HTH domain